MCYMEALIILSAIIFQFFLNELSKKIDYEYCSLYKKSAVVINIILWIVSYYKFEDLNTLIVMMIIQSILITILFIDLEYKQIPDIYILSLIILAFVFMFIYRPYFEDLLLSGFILFAIFSTVLIITGAIGAGDVKLVGAIGCFMGTGLIFKLIVNMFLIGAIIGIVLISLGKNKKDVFPFAPSISISTIIIIIQYF